MKAWHHMCSENEKYLEVKFSHLVTTDRLNYYGQFYGWGCFDVQINRVSVKHVLLRSISSYSRCRPTKLTTFWFDGSDFVCRKLLFHRFFSKRLNWSIIITKIFGSFYFRTMDVFFEINMSEIFRYPTFLF